MAAYYNEIDPFAAQWLRNLIAAGHITDGIVDERSIEDVRPSDLKGFTQCHFFAGIGVWSLALRSAGWSDDRPVWTGSCPCQPFSSSGKKFGFADERHLWPHFHWLIQECKPAVVIGEQVASKDADPWIDLVQTDLEALGYGVGAVAFPSAGVGAPHIRDRLYWVADAGGTRSKIGLSTETRRHEGLSGVANDCCGQRSSAERGSSDCRPPRSCGLGNTDSKRAGRDCGSLCGTFDREDGQHRAHHVHASGAAGGMADMHGQRFSEAGFCFVSARERQWTECSGINLNWPSPTNGFWRAADWLLCRDGKWRPVEPGTFPLAHGVAARVGRLRAYGNAINKEAAQAFIECVM